MYIWIVNTITAKDDKHFAYAERLDSGTELLSQMKHKGVQHAHLCDTKRQAHELAEFWNNCFRENGSYMF